MAVSRMLYGKFSNSLDLTRIMMICGAMCAGCYLLASLAVLPVLGLMGCALCGFAVGIMWPGSISISTKACPHGGTASPAMVGSLAEMAGSNLKTGLLSATIFPVVLIISLLMLKLSISKTPKLKQQRT